MRREERRGGEKDEDREKRTEREKEKDGNVLRRIERRRQGQRGGEKDREEEKDRQGEIRTDRGGGGGGVEGKRAGKKWTKRRREGHRGVFFTARSKHYKSF
jgi:hypothetical protein